MPSIAHVVFSGDPEPEIFRGTLFPLPFEFFSPAQIAFYRDCALGWTRCPLGYSVFSSKDSLSKKLVIPGIIIEGDNSKRRKFPNLSQRFARPQIEEYLKPHLSKSHDIRIERDLLFRRLTHDLRAISTEIYHEALAARESARAQKQIKIAESLDIVLSSQQMMSVRLDIVDYESGIATLGKATEVEVFKKVEKVFLALLRKMRAKNLTSSLEGQSFSSTLGPNTMDIALFVLMENAIKYSHFGGEVLVEVFENAKDVIVSIKSWGPCIASNERQRIFESGFRGAHAKRIKAESGSGVGLFAAATIAKEHFRGSIQVVQESLAKQVDDINYYETTFFITFPIHQKATAGGQIRQRFRRTNRRRGRSKRVE